MPYFAKVSNGKVVSMIKASEEFLATYRDNIPGRWVETFKDGSQRKNYAGVGFIYDNIRDAFIAPKPYPSWILNEDTCRWEPPTPYPADYNPVAYEWNEETQTWQSRESE